MARYRVKEKSFINNFLHETGAEIEYDGIPGPNLEPLDKPAEKVAASAVGSDKDSAERMRAAAAGVDLNDADALEKWKAAQQPAQQPATDTPKA